VRTTAVSYPTGVNGGSARIPRSSVFLVLCAFLLGDAPLELAGRDLVWAAAVQPPGPDHSSGKPPGYRVAASPGASHKMVFSRFLDGDWDIFTMNPDGNGLVNFTNQIPLDAHPAWNADSTLIAFASTRDRHNEIYTMNPDGTNVQRLTTTTSSIRNPPGPPRVRGSQCAARETATTRSTS
jgi:hypothetical protein